MRSKINFPYKLDRPVGPDYIHFMEKYNPKQRILCAAFAIIKEDGVKALSANQIIKKAGISKGGFFYHFPQMEELYLFILDSIISEFESKITPSKYKTFKTFIRAMAEYTFSIIENSPECMSAYLFFLGQINQKPEYEIKLKMLMNNTIESLAQKISIFFNKKLTNIQLDKMIRLIDMHLIGMSIHVFVFKDKKKYLALTNTFSEIIEEHFNGDKL